MDFMHTPVMLEECVESLNIKPDGIYIDGTMGGGGHSLEIFKKLDKNGVLLGIDQDLEALRAAEARLRSVGGQAELILVHSNFRNIKDILNRNGIKGVDGILLDIGVSSHQLDESERGFSYMKDAPLDMRMDKGQHITAKDIINGYSYHDLLKIISGYGEERWASRIAGFIVKARETKLIETTGELAGIIKSAIPAQARRTGPHPAKRTFQAIRIAVNDELGALKKVIIDGAEVLNKGGRFCIISFHSLEDRIVKEEFNRLAKPCTCPPEFPVCICNKKPAAVLITRKPITPGEIEVEENPRSRSAKLRVIEKI